MRFLDIGCPFFFLSIFFFPHLGAAAVMAGTIWLVHTCKYCVALSTSSVNTVLDSRSKFIKVENLPQDNRRRGTQDSIRHNHSSSPMTSKNILPEIQSHSRGQPFQAFKQSSGNTQFALAGLSEYDEGPRLSAKHFPHQTLDLEEDEKRKPSPKGGQQRSRLRDDDRKGHLDVILRATEQFLAQGDVAKAAKAFGIILQLRPRTQSIDIRLHNLWSIGAEILMLQRETLENVNRHLPEHSPPGQGGHAFPMAESRWRVSSSMSEIKSYFEILIRQYAYDHKMPHKLSALDFWLALLSCELGNIYAEHLEGIARLEKEIRLQHTDFAHLDPLTSASLSTSDPGQLDFENNNFEPQDETLEYWAKKQQEAICQHTLGGLQDINMRMKNLVDQLPYSRNAHFLQLQEMTSLLSADLASPPTAI